MSETSEESTEIVVIDAAASPVPSTAVMSQLEGMGFIMPLAQPEELRAAFAHMQRLYAAVLDPSDYIYTVAYEEHGKTRQFITANKAAADKVAKVHGEPVGAKPKKSGIVKLARALGIQAQCTLRQGLPEDPSANFSYCVYEAHHARTGTKEIGVGFCDRSERGGRISSHDMIATADTRAYNRAVLRLSGFGDVSADEVIAGASGGEELPAFVHEAAKAPSKPVAALPPPDDARVLTASRIWATAIVKRDGERFAADATQDAKAFRELRALARRGDESAAQKLGVLGLRWEGLAQDGPGHKSFVVHEPPVKPEDISAVEEAASPKADGSNGKSAAPAETAPAPPAETPTAYGIPKPTPGDETITTAQAKNVSALLMRLCGDSETDARAIKAKARGWLQANAGVERSSNIRVPQYAKLTNVLKEQLKKKEEASA